jgi:hypothetical protein
LSQTFYMSGPVLAALELFLDGIPGLLELGDARLVAIYLQLPFQPLFVS